MREPTCDTGFCSEYGDDIGAVPDGTGHSFAADIAAVRHLDREIIMPSGQETRTTSATGGEKGVKLARFSLVPWSIIREIAEHFGRGARKYADRNWERGYEWSKSYDALQRHLESFWNRDDIDHDPSLYVEGEEHTARHIIAVAWHALVLAFFSRYNRGTDDRPEGHTA